MKRRHFITLLGGGLLAACSSRLNPLAWFGSAEPVEPVARTGPARLVDPRPVVDTVTSLSLERTRGGAILRAAGVPDRQGWYDASLVPVPTDDPAILSYQLRAVPPPGPTRTSTAASRELVVAIRLSDERLAAVREIRVSGARNALAARR